jgi:hypothetical protein
METGSSLAVEGVGEAEEIAPRGHPQNGECSGDSESPAARGFCSAALVNKRQIGMNLQREHDRHPFAIVEARQRNVAG